MSIESKIEKERDLAACTTFRIGGQAAYYFTASDKDEFRDAIHWANKKTLPVFVVGGGSNLLVSDQGYPGLVIKIANSNLAAKGSRLECGAGTPLGRAVTASIQAELTGLEWAAGIPGTVAGAVRGNAGAYGSEMREVVENVEVYSREKARFSLYSNRDCRFDYRRSLFQSDQDKIIWQVILKLTPGNSGEINSLVQSHLASRQKGQPNFPSAGCVFRNLFLEDLKQANPELARTAEEAGVVKGGKVGAGWLIDRAGLKGKKIGDAKVSLEHGNFIVNTGKATAEEVVMLISLIKQQIRDNFNIQLMEEIEYVGF
jgi:UDP-N-acetylmuramate dehydrogenase